MPASSITLQSMKRWGDGVNMAGSMNSPLDTSMLNEQVRLGKSKQPNPEFMKALHPDGLGVD